ncbi:MAG: hypothetical protein F6K28_23550 [Microcoleus sp. SIO2G3]|nr:hypothetical protein [Microcoleus sp. SIO2G3]
MSAKIPIESNANCKDSFQAISLALRLSRSIAATAHTAVPPLRRYKADWPICYDSAIALKLAVCQQRSPSTIAQQITAACAIEGNWQTHITSSGLIRFQCSEPEIADYLQQLLSVQDDRTMLELHPDCSIPADSLFRVQYVHARCCLLLRSAVREGWLPSSPLPVLPWLTDTGELRLQHRFERQTIGFLLDAVDAIATLQTGDRLWKQAVGLSRSLDAFQAACRIWGEVKASDMVLAQARLGLTWAGQMLLRALLDRLGLDAPTLL